MKPRAFVKDVLTMVLAYFIIRLWITGERVTFRVGILMVIVAMMTMWFFLERFKT